MEKTFARLQSIICNEPVTKEAHPEFFRLVRAALLLALRERGLLNAAEYRLAAEALERRTPLGDQP